ncbi:hypothetical protein [Zhongshania sp.]|uniref:hypothetical protein n=1 Tax=Zhongshania sp. TaxID=1971902 RepID=UPI003564D970
MDRAKDMVVTAGENVYSTEVENCLSLQLGIAAAAVIGVPSEKWGEEVKAMIMAPSWHQPQRSRYNRLLQSAPSARQTLKISGLCRRLPAHLRWQDIEKRSPRSLLG